MEAIAASFSAGQITWATALICIVIAGLVGSLSGALSGLKLGGADIGKELALMMGSAYGPIGAVPGIIIGLIILKLMQG